MILGTLVRARANNLYGSAFANKIGRVEKVVRDKRLGTYFVLGFDDKVLSYPFYANEFDELVSTEKEGEGRG